ncbi:MAG: hypothetical protein QOE52_1969 [Mycobacterium sp.]|jgi:uncharacterized protein (DUF2267 family)|nr:hypothetical protein [Mycobacterium sp.]MDT5144210.1 hypothetical protein [Mycobacterium sp.]MDT5342785.1 hypothetical protein [Mycobacterium sp.]MDT7770854.1 hypothetical protein [Mycobacterium sp.]
MQYDELIALVAERAGLFKGDAIDLTRATLATLADRIGGGAVRELAAHLPGPLQDALLPTTEEAEAFSFEEFINRVAERTRRKSIVSESAVAAVMATLRDAVTPGEFDNILSQLPKDFHRLAER